MAQTIDLRTKEELPEPPQPPAPEIVAEEVAQTEDEPTESVTADWIAHLTPPPQHPRVWYMIGVLLISAILVAILAHDIMFTSVLALAAFVLFLNTFRPHQPSTIGIHTTGISIDDDHHRYADMKSFWIDYNPPHVKELSLEFKKGLTHRLRIPLQNQNPLEVRQVLMSYVPEKEHEPSMLDHLVRIIGI